MARTLQNLTALLTLAAVSLSGGWACEHRGGDEQTAMAPTSKGVPVVAELKAAKGARRLLLSPDGAWVGAELWLGGDDPLVKLIARSTGTVVATARGQMLAAPDDSGVLWMISHGEGDTWAARLLPGGSQGGSLAARADSLSPAYAQAVPLGPDRAAIVSVEGAPSALVVDLLAREASAPVTRWERDLGEGASLVGATGSADASAIYMLFEGVDGAAKATAMALDPSSGTERWRRELPELAPLMNGQIGLTGDGSTVLIYSSAQPRVYLFDAQSGTPLGALRLPVGPPAGRFTTVQGEAKALMLRGSHGAQERISWDLLSIGREPGGVQRLAGADEAPPTGVGARAGERLIAPFAAPYLSSSPQEWGTEVTDYLR